MSNFSLFSPAVFKRLVAGMLLEFSPILIFLASFEHFHIYKATMLLMIATIISTILTYRLQKRLPYLALYVAFLTICFGYLTVAHREPKFIQMRDSLYDLTCAVTLLIGIMINVQFLKLAFHEILPMTNRAWQKLTYLWIGFFLAAAILNEYIRRVYGLHVWFDYKSFMVVVTITFGFIALLVCYEKEGTPSHPKK
jgi:intracellular septation protein A